MKKTISKTIINLLQNRISEYTSAIKSEEIDREFNLKEKERIDKNIEILTSNIIMLSNESNELIDFLRKITLKKNKKTCKNFTRRNK
jgi:hypothetical protein